MGKSKGKISAFQFFVMLFLSRTLTTVTYLSSYTENIRLSDMLVQPFFRIIIGTLIMLPVFRLYRKHRDKNILQLINEKSQVSARIVAMIFVLPHGLLPFLIYNVVLIIIAIPLWILYKNHNHHCTHRNSVV